MGPQTLMYIKVDCIVLFATRPTKEGGRGDAIVEGSVNRCFTYQYAGNASLYSYILNYRWGQSPV